MKTLMNCDAAFEALTAGPVRLSAEASQELVAHLEGCTSCSELAAALRPACHLLHEALPPEAQQGLPQVLAADDEAVLRIMDRVTSAMGEPLARSHRPHRPQRPRIRPATAAGFATVACALLVLMGPWWSRGAATDGDFRDQLGQLQLPQACYHTVAHRAGSAAETQCQNCHGGQPFSPLVDEVEVCSLELDCCTSCHAAREQASPAPPVPSPPIEVGRLAAACNACHTPASLVDGSEVRQARRTVPGELRPAKFAQWMRFRW